MKQLLVFFYLSVFLSLHTVGQNNSNPVNLYLFPGQGSDYRIYKNMHFPDSFDVHYITLPTPNKNSNLKEYAQQFLSAIDTCDRFVLIGVSLGGMICSELAEISHPEKVILISSTKCREELPGRYRFQKYIPINHIVPKKTVKGGALFLQPIVEPDRNSDKETFEDMLKSKDPVYLKRTVDLIVDWDKKNCAASIYHIHGDNDHTIPIKNVDYDFLIEGGLHMMALTRAEEVNNIILEIIKK